MFGAASIVTGGFAGILVSILMPYLVSHPLFSFETPEWWPKPWYICPDLYKYETSHE